MLELYEIHTKLSRDRMHYIPIIVRVSFLRYLTLMFYKKLFNIHMFNLENKNPKYVCLYFKQQNLLSKGFVSFPYITCSSITVMYKSVLLLNTLV